MIAPFQYRAKPARVLFGSGRIDALAGIADELGCRRMLAVSTAGHGALADLALAQLGLLAAGRFAGAAMHTPLTVTETAMLGLAECQADGIVAIGGGSAIGLGKALALRTAVPLVAVPTTYAGSEMTDILGETKAGGKVTQRNPKVLPRAVIYDVDLTLALPPRVSAMSGLNAIAHAVEALYAQDGNPVLSLMAEEGIRALAKCLPRIVEAPGDREARSLAQFGAFLCGMCLGNASMALHHKLCHVLGGSFDLPHAETHAVVLPHAVAYNAKAVPDAMAVVARALGETDAAMGLHHLKERLVGPLSLKDLGMPELGIDRAAELACSAPYPNPRSLEAGALRACLANAYHGVPPQ